jgi:2'-5' RNA ligase
VEKGGRQECLPFFRLFFMALEQRRYTPHLSLARCAASVPDAMVHDFLAWHRELKLPATSLQQFSLYSSAFQEGVPVYRREQAYTMP